MEVCVELGKGIYTIQQPRQFFCMTDTEACIAMNMIPGMGPVRMRKLLEVFETPQRVLAAGREAMRSVDGIGSEVAETVSTWEKHVDLAAELKLIEEFGAKVIIQSSPEYPAQLKEIHNPPIVLYVWGNILPEDTRAIGVVGSRQTTHYGLDSAKKLSYQLAYSGYTVVSGLARGIDTAAHQGALAAKGRTLAVMGSGLMQIYPTENKGLAAKIAETGAVLSEYPMQRVADRQTFPYRNRIVAGWGLGLLVVEAGLNSGALITANQAIEQGRTVYAVPGQIDRPTSIGSNRLIQQGAKLVLGAEDIIDDLQTLFPSLRPTSKPQPATKQSASLASPKLSNDETLIVTALEAGELSLDELCASTRLPTYKISSTLLGLELKRLVQALPGQRYVKRSELLV